MKKIAFLTDRLKNGFGVDLVVTEQARKLSRDYDVTVFAINIDTDYTKDLPFKVKQLLIPLSFNPIQQDIITRRVWSSAKSHFENFDIFVLETPTFHGWLPQLSKIGKTLVYYHGNSPSEHYKGLKKYRCTLLNFLDNNVNLKYADQVISSSNFLKNSLNQDLQNNTVVIPLAGDHILKIKNSLSENRQKNLWKRFYIEKNDKVILYIGRLDYNNNPYKNTQDLFKLNDYLNKAPIASKSNLRIYAIGFPENGIEDEMHDAGIAVIPEATEEELAAVLTRSSLLISPSLWEGFNLPLIEAQTLGKPVVAYNLGAHPEVVGEKSGFIVNSFNDFAEKVLLLLRDDKLNKNMSLEASKFANEFTWSNNINLLKRYL